MKKTHWLSHDWRIDSLRDLLVVLELNVQRIKERNRKHPGFWANDWVLEALEPVYGMMFIACQNYIVGSIGDIKQSFDVKKGKHEFYFIGRESSEEEKSEIELIVLLANFAKHRDEDNGVSNHTVERLSKYGLDATTFYPEDGPLHNGFDLLSDNCNIHDLILHLQRWRKGLWDTYDLEQYTRD